MEHDAPTRDARHQTLEALRAEAGDLHQVQSRIEDRPWSVEGQKTFDRLTEHLASLYRMIRTLEHHLEHPEREAPRERHRDRGMER